MRRTAANLSPVSYGRFRSTFPVLDGEHMTISLDNQSSTQDSVRT